MSELKDHRNVLHEKLLDKPDNEATAIIKDNWANARLWIGNWWNAYKAWEGRDTFNKAVQDDRMTMRSFGSDFAFQATKTKPVNIAGPRFYGPGRQRLPVDDHKDAFASMNLPKHQRGIDTSAYANPANFASRKLKYEHGLHDLSVSLVVKGQNIKTNCHHQSETNPHFCFLPLSKGEDQYVLYQLIQYAKALKLTFPQLYNLVRDYRSQMTRVKLANDYDMGTGYTAVPTPDQPDGIAYKVTYGLGNTIKARPKKILMTTLGQLQARQQMYFQHRADIVRYGGNELVIAMRQHAGSFPVYAYYDDAAGDLKCFDIVNGKRVENGRTISVTGVASW